MSSSHQSGPLPCKETAETLDKTNGTASTSGTNMLGNQTHKALCFVALEVYLLKVIVDQSKDKQNPFAESSWMYPLAGTMCYLLFVYLGMKYMKTREAFNVKQYMIIYNLYQTLFNIYVTVGFGYELYTRGMKLVGNVYTPGTHEFGIGFLIYAHYQNKYIEYFDTIFMVLRKKNKQVSFLHVYHHSLMVWAWYAVMVTNAGGDAYFGAMANSIIHIVMYSYYLMSLLGIACPWKKYVTLLQLVQFICVFTHGCVVGYLGSTPRWLVGVQQFVMLNMFGLFMNFYTKSYKQKALMAKQAKEEKKVEEVKKIS